MTAIVIQSLFLFVLCPAFIGGVLAYMMSRDSLAVRAECPRCGVAEEFCSIGVLRAQGGHAKLRYCAKCDAENQAALFGDPEFEIFVQTMRALVPDQTPHPQEERPCH